jgi:putative phosphoesterase
MKIGIIADTHGILPGEVLDIFSEVQFIFHAGDIGSDDVIEGLKIISPVYAVYGNVDTWPITIHYPDMLVTKLDDLHICLVHQIPSPKIFSYQLFKKGIKADIVIFGHTHAAGFEHFRNILFLNPGSAVKPRDRRNGTIALLNLKNEPLLPEIVEIK